MAKKPPLEKEVILSKSVRIVDTKPTHKEVDIPKGHIVWESVDAKGNKTTGFINQAGLQDMINYHAKNNIPFTYDQKKNP